MEKALKRPYEFYTLQGMESNPNDSDDGIPWDEWIDFTPDGWVNFTPDEREWNGGELIKGGMLTEGVDNTPRQCLGPTNGK